MIQTLSKISARISLARFDWPYDFAPAGIKVAIQIRVSYDAPEGMNQK